MIYINRITQLHLQVKLQEIALHRYIISIKFGLIDSNIGILMVQSILAQDAHLFKEQLSNYFISKGYKAEWSKCIPNEYRKVLEDGYISEIQVIHRKRD